MSFIQCNRTVGGAYISVNGQRQFDIENYPISFIANNTTGEITVTYREENIIVLDVDRDQIYLGGNEAIGSAELIKEYLENYFTADSDPSLQTVTATGNTTTRRIKYTGDNLIVSVITSPITALVLGGNTITFDGPTLADYVGQSNVVLSLYVGANVVALAEVVTYTIDGEVTPGIYDQELGINITHLIAAADNIDITKFTFFQFDNDALITSREAERRYAANPIYLALLNQVGTDAPTATVLNGINTLGIVDADYSYFDAKNYYLTKIGAFSLGTIVTIQPFGGTSGTSYTPVAAVILDDDTIQIASPGSNILNNFWFKIERYTVTP